MASEIGKCPWCRTQFTFDPSLAAFAYRCPDCKRESLIDGLRIQERKPNAIAIHQVASEALAENFFPFTLAIRYRAECEDKIATGTLCHIGDRDFVITAGHVLNSKSASDARFISKCKQLEAPVKIDIAKVEKREFEDVDVGLIEFAKPFDASRLCAASLSLDRVKDFGVGDPTRSARVYGYPSALIRPDGRDVLKIYNVSLGTTAVEVDLWESIDREANNPRPDKDIVLRFDRSNEFWSHGPSEVRTDKPPDPYGMSGGGCWHGEMHPDSREVWSPEEVCLFGIQSQWPRAEKGGRFLRAVQVVHWLRLVADHYPDLNDELVARYPRIEDVRRQ